MTKLTVREPTALADCCKAFADSYEISTLPEMRQIERAVLGCDYGGTSWTTAAQAKRMASALDLSAGEPLLEIGAGAGWPGLFLAGLTGCRTVLLDLPLNALQKAARRACRESMATQIGAIVGSGSALPLAAGCFPAISHSDVLCCLPDKRRMLEECRRVAARGARMVFAVIYLEPELGDRDRQRALEAGPPFLAAPASYATMLSDSGWRIVETVDVTADFCRSLESLVSGLSASEAVRERLGGPAIAEEIGRRNIQLDVIRDGHMKRVIYACR